MSIGLIPLLPSLDISYSCNHASNKIQYSTSCYYISISLYIHLINVSIMCQLLFKKLHSDSKKPLDMGWAEEGEIWYEGPIKKEDEKPAGER
jgi:hypothetical protein